MVCSSTGTGSVLTLPGAGKRICGVKSFTFLRSAIICRTSSIGRTTLGRGANKQIPGKKPAVFSLKKADVVAVMARSRDYLETEMIGSNCIADFLNLAGDRIAPDLFLIGIKGSRLVDFVYG